MQQKNLLEDRQSELGTKSDCEFAIKVATITSFMISKNINCLSKLSCNYKAVIVDKHKNVMIDNR